MNDHKDVTASTSHSGSTILLVMAMEEEAAAVLKILPFQSLSAPLEEDLPPHGYTTQLDHLNVALVVNGQDPVYRVASFGTDAATLATYLGIRAFAPDLVISAGVAGGFKAQGAEIGTVYVSEDSVRYIDRRVSITEPNYRDYAVGFYPVADASQMAQTLGLPTGIVVTGGSFENSPEDEAQIRAHGAVAIEMEATSVAKMSMLIKTPFLAVKAVVNFEEDPAFADQFERNFHTATACLAHTMKEILQYYTDHEI